MKINNLRSILGEQIDDPGLWVEPLTTGDVVHAYLQQELRKLHQAVEEHLKECEGVDNDRP